MLYEIIAGRSTLTVDLQGVQLSNRRLRWTEVQRIAVWPASPVLRYFAFGPPAVRVHGDQRGRHIDVTHDHIKDLDTFADWLRSTQECQTSNVE
jgi:hypothetical protein